MTDIDAPLVGQKIVEIRPMTDSEMEHEGWGNHRGINPPVIELESGAMLFPSRDPEGNGPGALFGEQHGEEFIVDASRD
jgi:hypothetical protein